MKFRHLILMMTTAVAACSLPSCTNDDYLVTANEEYTRNFIETFGLIHPDQDWNLAKRSAVTVNAGETPSEVKAYMKVDNTYYLVASLDGVSGSINIPFDMPEGTDDIMVKINGKRYYTAPGGTVDPAAASRATDSRAAAGSIDSSTGLGISGTYGSRSVSISKTEETQRISFDREAVNTAEGLYYTFTYSLPDYYDFGIDVDYNFSANVKEFYVFNEYYYLRDKKNDDTFGIYWEVSPTAAGAENIKVTDPNGKEHSYWIVRVPILQNPINLENVTYEECETIYEFPEIPNWEEIFISLKENFPDNYFYGEEFDTEDLDLSEDGPWSVVIASDTYPSRGAKYHLFSDGKYREIVWSIDRDLNGDDFNHEIRNDIISLYPDLFFIDSGGGFTYMTGNIKDYHTVPYSFLYLERNMISYNSRGVHVVLDDFHEIGFYFQVGNNITYSQTKLNEWGAVSINGAEENRQINNGMSFKEGKDMRGNDRRYIGYNLSDEKVLFRIYGLDDMSGLQAGYVINEDKKPQNPFDPDKPYDPETPEVEEPYHWLLAVEDLGATDDFDFNDIILGITAELTTETPGEGARTVGEPLKGTSGGKEIEIYGKVTFTALAAGGTLPAYVYYGDEQLYPDGHPERAEWHRWFGDGSISHTTMINTNHGRDNEEGAGCTIYFGVEDDSFLFSVETLGLKDKESADARDSGFRIGIDKAENISSANISSDYFTKGADGYFVKPTGAGKAPQMFLIPDRWNREGDNTGTSTYDTCKWQWPAERQHIQAAYSRFAEWVSDPEGAAGWYKDTGTGVCRPTPN